MASVIKTSGGKMPGRAVQFSDASGDRRTIRLGKVGLEAAREFKRKVESLLSWSITNQSPDAQTSAWLAGLSDKMHGKLAALGLVEPREPEPTSPTLSAWLTKYIGQREADLKPSSIKELRRTESLLIEHFGADLCIDQISANTAKDWRAWLAGRNLAEATVRLQCRNAKTIFNEAVERELLSVNQFRKLASRAIAADRDRYVTPDEAETILAACPNVRWRALFGLARLAGLRVPSETHILTWADVDWDRARLSVFSPKTERYEKHRRRAVPIVPKLMGVIQDAFDAADEGQELVVGLSRNNLHRTMHSILKRAEIEPWDRYFQVLRQSCETEWSERFPQHAVSAWLGHSEAVSREHYLQVTDAMFERAVTPSDTTSGRGAAESAAKGAAAGSRTESQGLANGQSASDASPHENPVFLGSNAANATGPGGIRTPDQAIMSRRLYR